MRLGLRLKRKMELKLMMRMRRMSDEEDEDVDDDVEDNDDDAEDEDEEDDDGKDGKASVAKRISVCFRKINTLELHESLTDFLRFFFWSRQVMDSRAK